MKNSLRRATKIKVFESNEVVHRKAFTAVINVCCGHFYLKFSFDVNYKLEFVDQNSRFLFYYKRHPPTTDLVTLNLTSLTDDFTMDD